MLPCPVSLTFRLTLLLFAAVKEHVKFYGLEDLFPGTGLEAAFNSSAEFRTGIREAMRDDLFIEDELSLIHISEPTRPY